MPALDPRAIGKRLEALRESRSLSQRQLAKDVGIAQSAISDYEKGKRLPTTNALQKLLNFFDVPASELMSPAENTPEESKRRFLIRNIEDRLQEMSIEGLMVLSSFVERVSVMEQRMGHESKPGKKNPDNSDQ